MNYTDASAIDDASELVVSVVSPQESVIRISSVLKEREEWLRAQGLETSTEMDWDQRGQFIKWCMDKFMAEPGEQARDEANRQKGKNESKIKAARRTRFNLEKQRRAGSSQIWELLSYTGRVSEEYLRDALRNVEQSGSAYERAGEGESAELKRHAHKVKHELRYGKTLQHREAKYKDFAQSLSANDRRILAETKDGTLKRKVNEAVLQRGRGRLRGATDDDYLDIGTNRERSVVQRILDGNRPAPDTSRFEREK